MSFHESPRFPTGFRCAAAHCGIKESGEPDLSLFASERPASAAAVFTRNQVPGAPVRVGRELIRGGRLQAVVVNSRVANVGTGAEGVARARRMGAAAASALDIQPELVLMSSTGVIGVPLPIDKIEATLPELAGALQDDPMVGARGIMTTDTHPKALSMDVDGTATLTVVAKGSGMIEPNMATMLVYAFTDAELDPEVLDRALRGAVDGTFNMLSVDSDTSTSDTCALLANGMAGPVEEEAFRGALRRAFEAMTETLARDGEGASTLLRITVTGAATRDDARTVAKSLVNSPLVKTMVAGGDPNVGRILMAVGKCFEAGIDPDRIQARVCGVTVLEEGGKVDFDEAAVRRLLGEDPVDIEVELGVGEARARAWGCDLTHGYIEENAAYYST
jgi:glutamate N-acetyltransferase/amino-acid N-acetyltransferase